MRKAKEGARIGGGGSGLFHCWRAHAHPLIVSRFPMQVSIAPSFLYIQAYCLA